MTTYLKYVHLSQGCEQVAMKNTWPCWKFTPTWQYTVKTSWFCTCDLEVIANLMATWFHKNWNLPLLSILNLQFRSNLILRIWTCELCEIKMLAKLTCSTVCLQYDLLLAKFLRKKKRIIHVSYFYLNNIALILNIHPEGSAHESCSCNTISLFRRVLGKS